MVETHRQDVIELLDRLDALAISQLFQRGDAIAQTREVDANRLELQSLALGARNGIEILETAIGPGAGIIRQKGNTHVIPLSGHFR